MHTMLGCLNIRVQGKKCIYLRSPQAAANDETRDATPHDIQQLALQTTRGSPLIPTGNLATTIQNLDPTCLISKSVILSHRPDPTTPTQPEPDCSKASPKRAHAMVTRPDGSTTILF